MSIDFTNCKKLVNDFGGSEKKKKIIYNDEIYMMKFPDPVREQNENLSYMNNQYSEYLGCHIFDLCGMNTQKTLLGKYLDEDSKKEKVVVACRSFENDGLKLIEFSKLLLSSNTDSKKNEKLELNSIEEIFENEKVINNKKSIEDFYDTLVIDTLIGNGDRHEDNFGFVYKVDDNDEKMTFSPIYDCGSCLTPLKSDTEMERLLKNDADFKNEEYNLTYRYCNNGKRIFMHEFFSSPNEYLKSAISRMYDKIDLDKIYNLIDDTEYMSDIRKEYNKKSIELRYNNIINPAFRKSKNL